MTPSPNRWISWNGRISHPYNRFLHPRSEAELAEFIAASPGLRVLGTGRSSADICAGTTDLVSLDQLPGEIEIDEANLSVSAPAGIDLAALLTTLQSRGYGIAALPDIDCISLGGAVATGTHGTGRQAQTLSDYLVACRLITADGTILDLSENTAQLPFDALRVSLGLLGVMTKLSFRIEPLRPIAVYERPCHDSDWVDQWQQLIEQYDFTRLLWLPHTGWGTLITGDFFDCTPPFAALPAPAFHAQRRAVSARLYGISARLPGLTPLANRLLKSLFFSAEVRKVGSLYDATVTKSRGSTLELAEWTIPIGNFKACFNDLRRHMGKRGCYGHIPMDVRFIRRSSAWLANNYDCDCVTIGCVSRTPEFADRHKIFGIMESIFLNHGGRPHWAKRFGAGQAQLDKLYPRLPDFRALRRQWDPQGKFLNPWLAERFL